MHPFSNESLMPMSVSPFTSCIVVSNKGWRRLLYSCCYTLSQGGRFYTNETHREQLKATLR